MVCLSLLAVALTNVAELATLLKSDEPETGSFDFRANVSCIVSGSLNDAVLTFSDASGSVAVRTLLETLNSRVASGDLVQAHGHIIRPDKFTLEAWLDKIDLLRHEDAPVPPERTIAELYSGRFDWQPARLRGEIRNAFASETSANWAIMILVAEKRLVSVSTPLNGTAIEEFHKLIGRQVAIDGFVNPDDGSIRLYIGRVFHCPSINAIHLIGAPPDPFDAPPIETLKFLRPSEIAAHGRIRTFGKVISTWGDGQMLLRRENGRPVQAICLGQSRPARGDSIVVVGDVGEGETAIRKALKLRPDVLIVDLLMPEMDGIETTRQLRAKWPEAKVLILTTLGTSDGFAHALEAGALGAILKSADLDELRQAIAAVAEGRRYVSEEVGQIMSEDPPLPELSLRQREILESVTRGLSNPEIATQLDISLPMVKEHLNVLFAKIGAANRVEAVAIALRKQLLKL